MLLQDKINIVESYVYQNREWQLKLVKYLDHLCDPRTDINQIAQLVFTNFRRNEYFYSLQNKKLPCYMVIMKQSSFCVVIEAVFNTAELIFLVSKCNRIYTLEIRFLHFVFFQ